LKYSISLDCKFLMRWRFTESKVRVKSICDLSPPMKITSFSL